MWPSKALLTCTLAIVFLVMLAAPSCYAGPSVDMALDSRVYRDLEVLEMKGLVPSAVLATRPFGREEGARLVQEAKQMWEMLPDGERDAFTEAAMGRLEREFRVELSGQSAGGFFFKPVENLYVKNIYAGDEPYFASINNNGDELKKGYNLRAGLAFDGGFFDILSFHVNPEYRHDDGGSAVVLRNGYVKLGIAGVEIEAGRDSLWWGPGYHGGLIMTNNARPFDMVKLTSQKAFLLPWVFSRIGPVKPTVFLTRLEKNRVVPRANLLGMRLDFKPSESFRFGLSRVFLFGGDGRRSLTAADWVKVFYASNSAEHTDSPINGDQIAAVDADYVFVNRSRYVPFSGLKLYAEWGAEDSSGKTKTPTGRALLYGAFVTDPFWIEGADFRVERADTARNARYGPTWYTHGVYQSGYTYYGRVIGHHMGGDSRDLFTRFQYHARKTTIGVEADDESSGIHGTVRARRKYVGADLACTVKDGVTVAAGWGFEDVKDPADPPNRSGHTVWLDFALAF